MSNQQLQDAYIDLLKNVDTSYLDIPDRRPSGLSGLFLPSVGDNYQAAKNKVMIIGSETAGWEPLARKVEGKVIYGDLPSVEGYVAQAMQKHQSFFAKMLSQKTQDRGHTFHNFTRNVAKVTGKDGLVYSNLFCFDWRKSELMSNLVFTASDA